jgi:hypothetical protein
VRSLRAAEGQEGATHRVFQLVLRSGDHKLQAPGIDTVFRVRSVGVFLRINDDEPIVLHDVYRVSETIIVSLPQRPSVA